MSNEFEWGRDFLPHFWESYRQGEFEDMQRSDIIRLQEEAQAAYDRAEYTDATPYLQATMLAEIALQLARLQPAQPQLPQLFRLVDGRVINLDNVTRVYKGESANFNPCLIIEYVGGEQSLIFPDKDKQTYQQVSAWMESLPSLSLYEM